MKKINKLAAFALTFILAVSAGAFTAFADSEFVIRGDRDEYELEFEKDKIFQVTFVVDNNTEVTHGDFMIKYDPSVIQAVEKTEDNTENYLGYTDRDGETVKFFDDYLFLNEVMGYIPPEGHSEFDGADGVKTEAELGRIKLIAVSFDGSGLRPAQNSGKLMTICFKMVAEGEAQVEITKIPGFENMFYNESDEPLNVESRAVTVKLVGSQASASEEEAVYTTELSTEASTENSGIEETTVVQVFETETSETEKTAEFDDISGFPWAEEAIEALASKGIINGVGNNRFAPEANVKRGDFLLMLMNALELEGQAKAVFDDVAPDAYYANAVCLAKDLGIANGKTESLFCPDELITRQDMTVLAANAIRTKLSLDNADEAVLDRFDDKAEVSAYAQQALADMVYAGIVSGTGSSIEPKANTTRAQAAVIIYNIYNKVNEG